jgi:hypothetical protein
MHRPALVEPSPVAMFAQSLSALHPTRHAPFAQT